MTQSRTNLWRGNFHVHNDGSEGSFSELCGVVDGVSVQNHQLQGFGELKYSLNLTLNLRCTDETHLAYTYVITEAKRLFVLMFALLPRLERVLDLSMMGLLFRTDLFAKDRSAVTRVMEIL